MGKVSVTIYAMYRCWFAGWDGYLWPGGAYWIPLERCFILSLRRCQCCDVLRIAMCPPQQIRFGTAHGRSIVAVLLVEEVAAGVQRVNLDFLNRTHLILSCMNSPPVSGTFPRCNCSSVCKLQHRQESHSPRACSLLLSPWIAHA